MPHPSHPQEHLERNQERIKRDPNQNRKKIRKKRKRGLDPDPPIEKKDWLSRIIVLVNMVNMLMNRNEEVVREEGVIVDSQ